MNDRSQDIDELLRSAAEGSQRALGELLDRHRERLRRMICFRMHRRVRKRVDPSDVIQEAFIDAASRLQKYVANPSVSFYVWLRYLTSQRLQMVHRHHLGVQSRDARREVSLEGGEFSAATSAVLAAHLLKGLTSPSTAAVRREIKQQLLTALDAMEPMDREVLALRHFEQLSNNETAQALGITPTAANNRYVRALERFRPLVLAMPDTIAESQA
jgi:RNA polymerase sigma-70 factor (ECF subfamily)